MQIKDAQEFFEEKFAREKREQLKNKLTSQEADDKIFQSEEERAANERVKQMIEQHLKE